MQVGGRVGAGRRACGVLPVKTHVFGFIDIGWRLWTSTLPALIIVSSSLLRVRHVVCAIRAYFR